MPATHFALGRLRFSIAGEHPVVACIVNEFEPLRVATSDDTPHIRFGFTDRLTPMTGASHVKPLAILDDRFALTRGYFRYQVAESPDGLDVTLEPVRRKPMHRLAPDRLARIADWNFLTRDQVMAKDFIYDVFDYISQIAQLPLGQSHLHASSFERDGDGVAILAWGGVGKTTAMLKLVLEDGWRYLSDDLVTIDRAGTLWRSPKWLQVYAYNIAGDEGVRRALMSGRTLTDRSAWLLHRLLRGPDRVRRRVSAERLFGQQAAATSATLRHAIYIERVDCPDFTTRDLSVDDLADRATAAVLKELQPFIDLTLALHSGERHPVMPAVQAMHDATRNVLRDALSQVQPVCVRIPLLARPNDLARYLRPLIDRSARSAT